MAEYSKKRAPKPVVTAIFEACHRMQDPNWTQLPRGDIAYADLSVTVSYPDGATNARVTHTTARGKVWACNMNPFNKLTSTIVQKVEG